MLDLLTDMVSALRNAILERSSLPAKQDERLEVMIGVPANANSNQRFLTVEPFLRSGFSVLGLLNEPSAASVEYGHRKRSGDSDEQVMVYALGGGTFDASLVRIEGHTHSVLASEGVPDVGGDDFDIVLAEMALEAAGIQGDSLTQAEVFRLHEECRGRKEALHPNTKRIIVDLSAIREEWNDVLVPAAAFYERCRPLIDLTVQATERLLERQGDAARADALYVTGGGSEMPMVARMLREVFGRRVKRSAYTRSATAIGLAIQADVQAGYVLRESFTRHFGVWREWEGGRRVTLDVLFPKGTPLPGPIEHSLLIHRSYCPVHNVGHFRYLECSHMSDNGQPAGDITVWDEIRFPFDPSLQHADNLREVPVEHADVASAQVIEERYSCNAAGLVEVRISNLTAGYTRTYRLGRWAGKEAPVVAGKKRKVRVEAR
jgi:molecular chaperone DnaK (HSP70)